MTPSTLELLKYLMISSIVIYYLFMWLESRRINDEREELINLKSTAFVQKSTLAALSLLALAYSYDPSMPALIPIWTLVIANLYSEIFSKFYYRRKY